MKSYSAVFVIALLGIPLGILAALKRPINGAILLIPSSIYLGAFTITYALENQFRKRGAELPEKLHIS